MEWPWQSQHLILILNKECMCTLYLPFLKLNSIVKYYSNTVICMTLHCCTTGCTKRGNAQLKRVSAFYVQIQYKCDEPAATDWLRHVCLVYTSCDPCYGVPRRIPDPLSYTVLLEDLLGIKQWSQKHGGWLSRHFHDNTYFIFMVTATDQPRS
jgi:hypothetical protein